MPRLLSVGNQHDVVLPDRLRKASWKCMVRPGVLRQSFFANAAYLAPLAHIGNFSTPAAPDPFTAVQIQTASRNDLDQSMESANGR
jgi:hypothetical protein